ncbi:hypothetical protein ACFPIJ_35410 [Dactylosporangium cerinum]|uniref:Uncharacterized protein n=1 Tax=Dactylosporangium cerinum TaxID=1434730 RepID=A0ABV9W701_9ACTN
MVELLAEIGFKPVQLLDERGPVDADGARGGVDGGVGHRDGESLESFGASSVGERAVQVVAGPAGVDMKSG